MRNRRKGTLRPNYSTNSGIFEKRGDPWVSQREGVKDFQRNPETEDAELDFDRRFHNVGGFGPKIAKPKPEYHDPMPEAKDDDPERRKASIARRMQMRMNKRATVNEVIAPTQGFKPCAGCRAAQCVAHNRCFGALR